RAEKDGHRAHPLVGHWQTAPAAARPHNAPARGGRRHYHAPAVASPRSTRGKNTMSIIWTILIGFVVGLIARAVKPGDDSAGFIVTTVIGILGSVVATYLGQAMGWYAAGQPASFIASVLGAIVLLVLWGLIRKKT